MDLNIAEPRIRPALAFAFTSAFCLLPSALLFPMLSLITLAAVFALIATRRIGSLPLPIWVIMTGGALVVLLGGSIGPNEAWKAIDWRVILFLACMFVIGRALEESGYLEHLAYLLFRHAASTDALVLLVLFTMGLLSALLMNDTLAIVGVPVVLLLAGRHRMSPKLLLLALAFSITIGSVMSPIGNPQNLLIAFHLENPFVTFLQHLFLPSMLCLLLAYGMLRLFYWSEFHRVRILHLPAEIRDRRLAILARLSLFLLAGLIGLKVVLAFEGTDFNIVYIAVVAVVPVLFGKRGIITEIDWRTLVFFVAMFVLMESVWLEAGESLIPYVTTDTGAILLLSTAASQLVSNVPFVALGIPPLLAAGGGARELVALAAGSTVAGLLFILGAASNVIIIQQAEARGETLTFAEFARVGIPLTAACLVVFWIFLR